MPKVLAKDCIVSENSLFSIFIINDMTSPPSEQAPKQRHVWRSGLMKNDGVLSEWNGHSPLRFLPVCCRVT